jgi:hypothetical protein
MRPRLSWFNIPHFEVLDFFWATEAPPYKEVFRVDIPFA